MSTASTASAARADSVERGAGEPDAVVVVAMDDEAAPVIERATAVGPEQEHAGVARRTLTLGRREVLLLRSGIGLVNAAAALAAVLAAGVRAPVVSAGTAGGLGVAVRVGDVVVGTHYVHAGADATAFGYAVGQVPGMPARYEGDPALISRLTGPEAVATGWAVRAGLVVSSDSFVTAAQVETVRAAFPAALSTDMESLALAQVCHRYGVPFASARGVSDLCGPAADADFLTHVDDAADRSADVLLAALVGLEA